MFVDFLTFFCFLLVYSRANHDATEILNLNVFLKGHSLNTVIKM